MNNNYKSLLIILITLILILILAFLIKPVKNYIYKPQRYIEYIHPTSYRDPKFLDKVVLNNRNDEHHGLIDLSLLDQRYIKDTVNLPNRGMIHIWFQTDTNGMHLNHFYVDYDTNPTHWRFNNSEDRSRYEIGLDQWQSIHFSPEIPKWSRKDRYQKCSQGYYNDNYFITTTKTVKDENNNHIINYKFVFDNKNLNLLSYYYKQE